MDSEMRLAEVSAGGVQTDVLEAGSGPPLLFLHSGNGPNSISSTYLRDLGRSFRVYAPVHPGFGRLDRPTHFRDVNDLAYFYLDLLSQLRLRDVVLVGASFGGWIAAEVAIRSCADLARLVLIDPLGLKAGARDEREIADLFILDAEQRAALEFVNPEFVRVDYSGKSDEELAAIARGREAEVHFGWKPYMHNPQLGHWLHRIGVPSLLIRGEHDRVVRPENHARFTELLPNAQGEIIPGAGHHPHIEQPSSVAKAITRFALSEA